MDSTLSKIVPFHFLFKCLSKLSVPILINAYGTLTNEQSVNTGVRNAVGGGSGIAGNAQNDNTGVKNAGAVAVDKADTVQNVYKGRPLGRRDIVSVNTTDTDNGFLYQPREVRRMRKQQSHSAVVGTREANGGSEGLRPLAETYSCTESRTMH